MELKMAAQILVHMVDPPEEGAEDTKTLVERCNEHGTIYAISSDFGDRMTIQHLD